MLFFQKDQTLETLGQQIIETTQAEFPGLAANQIALTWLVYDSPVPVNTGGALSPEELWKYQIRGFSYRGVERIYPGKMVSLFYLVAIYEWLHQEMITSSPELERAVRDMIQLGNRDALSLVVDVLTGTTSGPELPIGPFETWMKQRNFVNRYYQSLGWSELATINVNQKLWGDGVYGRERAFLGEMMENRNMVTTDGTARLLHSIVGGVAVSPPASQTMMNLLKQTGEQGAGFFGAGLPAGAQIWSQISDTDSTRHEAAYIELPDQKPYLLVVFTEGKNQSQNKELFPFISQQIITALTTLSNLN